MTYHYHLHPNDALKMNAERIFKFVDEYSKDRNKGGHIWADPNNMGHGKVVKLWNGPKGNLWVDLGSDRDSRATDTVMEMVNMILRYFYGAIEIKVGGTYTEYINQADRVCEVIDVKRKRFRVEFEMPNVTQQGWRNGIPALGTMYYRPELALPYIRQRTGESIGDWYTRREELLSKKYERFSKAGYSNKATARYNGKAVA